MPELKKFNLETQDLAPKGADVSIERGGEVLGVGIMEGTVRRVGVERIDLSRPTRKLALAEKELDAMVFEGVNRGRIKRILENHALLKIWKLPTIPTMRVDESNPNVIYMTDLTRGGKDAVYSMPDWFAVDGREGKLFGSEKMIALANPKELSLNMAELFRRTVEVGCMLNHADIFFLIVDGKTKNARVLFGDLLRMDIVPEMTEDIIERNYLDFWSFIAEMNTHLTADSQFTVQSIDQVRRELLKEIREKKSKASDDAVSAE